MSLTQTLTNVRSSQQNVPTPTVSPPTTSKRYTAGDYNQMVP